jgi:hypothetical protein
VGGDVPARGRSGRLPPLKSHIIKRGRFVERIEVRYRRESIAARTELNKLPKLRSTWNNWHPPYLHPLNESAAPLGTIEMPAAGLENHRGKQSKKLLNHATHAASVRQCIANFFRNCCSTIRRPPNRRRASFLLQRRASALYVRD